jgi:hypothetical protein
MSEHANTVPRDDIALAEFAAELRRLANEVVRDVRRGTPLPGLSHLVAMRPLQEMLTRTLSNRVLSEPTNEDEGDDAPIPGYL